MKDAANIRFFNTLTRRVEPFVPLTAGHARMYTCGPTVYDFPHIGNYRAYVWEDLLRRFLKHRGFTVTQVMNITDVDDKTIRDSRKAGLSLRDFTDRYVHAFFDDLETLGIEKAEHYPRATDHIPEMIDLIQRLARNGHTYESEGSVYYRISTFPAYGRLSNLDASGIKAGARVELDEYEKDDVRDFVLWKARKEGEPAWSTPMGEGRPGWHIECSAMSMKYLGPSFDIHTGGVDNIFPHHENEIAQSEAATGVPFVRYWLHCAHLVVEGEKMSKSKGNCYTLRDLLSRGLDARAIRYLLLSSHYRKPLNFTVEGAHQAAQAIARLDDFADRLDSALSSAGGTETGAPLEGAGSMLGQAARLLEAFEAALDDDLNTAEALASVFDTVRLIHSALDRGEADAPALSAASQLLGSFRTVFGVPPRREATVPDEVAEMIRARQEARRRRDFIEADRLRAALLERGYVLEDTADGVRWKRSS